MNFSEQCRLTMSDSKRRSKETLNEMYIDDVYEELISYIFRCARGQMSKCRLFYDDEKRYGLDQENVRKEILDKLKNDGFEVSRGSSGWMARVDFLQISWE